MSDSWAYAERRIYAPSNKSEVLFGISARKGVVL